MSQPRRSVGRDAHWTQPKISFAMEYVLNPIYDRIAALYPSWWTPNGITLVGLTCTILASLLFFTEAVAPVTNPSATAVAAAGARLPVSNGAFDPRPSPTNAWRASLAKVALPPVQKPAAAAAAAASSNDTAVAAAGSAKAAPADAADAPARAQLYSWMTLPPAAMPGDGAFVHVTDANKWIFIAVGVLNLIYTVADNTDGKHARRYKMSSTLGEYLDHGGDGIASMLSAYVIAIIAGERVAFGGVLQFALGMMTVMSHFHHFDANEFITGDRIFSVDEATVFIAALPLAIAVWPALQDAVAVPGTDIRLVQVLAVVFLTSVTSHCVIFAARNRRTLNPLVFFIAATAAGMFAWARVHEGGVAAEVAADLAWWRDNVAAAGAAAFGCAGGTAGASATPAASAATLPAGVSWFHGLLDKLGLQTSTNWFARAAFQCLAFLCPPHVVHFLTERALRFVTCYPALWALTSACAISIVVHIPVAARCLKARQLSFVPFAGAAFAVFLFGVSPVAGAALAVAWHAAQILYNCAAIIARRG